MPRTNEELPSTLERSPEKVQRTYEKTLDSAGSRVGLARADGPGHWRGRSRTPLSAER